MALTCCKCISEADARCLWENQNILAMDVKLENTIFFCCFPYLLWWSEGAFMCFYIRSLRVLLSIGGTHCLLNNGMGWRITFLKSLSRYNSHSMLLSYKGFDMLSFFFFLPSCGICFISLFVFAFDRTCIAFKQWGLISAREAVCQQAQYHLGSGKPVSLS